ncbi:PilZ domain-containing protein [Deferrisoma camini]|uniref:PilZ domain-containing protein n=1 Tax=Deferrisoma camini TaxID=1035120 RepID=UPI00046CBEDD|nr:PilZ domain-containing protein [Deferrisoma camini]
MQKRRRTRVSTGKEATVEWAGGRLQGGLRDVSLKGAYVWALGEARPAEGEEGTVRIHLDPHNPALDLEIRCRAVRVEGDGVALDFLEVPAEVFPHLLRLVQYNAPDPDGIEEEILAPAFRREDPGGE